MIFSDVESMVFLLSKFSFSELSPQVTKYYSKDNVMSFSGKVTFMEVVWEAEEFDENGKNILHLFAKLGQGIFRIELIFKSNGKTDINQFISGNIRQYDSGDWIIEAMLNLRDLTISKNNVCFKLKKFESYSRAQKIEKNTTEKNHFEVTESWSKDKLSQYATWSKDDVYNWACFHLNVEHNDAQLLRNQEIDGSVLNDLSQDVLNSFGMTFGSSRKIIKGIEYLNKI
jgi:hypothetical protein